MNKAATDTALARGDASQPKSVTARMALRYGMETGAFQQTLMATVMKGKGSPEQVAAFLLVAEEYQLNPFLKEIYAFPQAGGIVPIVSVDGWHKIANEHPQYDGHDQEVVNDPDLGVGVKTIIHRKDRGHPTSHIEWLNECRGTTEPWKKWPQRMLGHKSFIQCARKAFSFAGIYDPDEAERIRDVEATVSPAAAPKPRGVKALADSLDSREVVDVEPPPAKAEAGPDDAEFFDALLGNDEEADA